MQWQWHPYQVELWQWRMCDIIKLSSFLLHCQQDANSVIHVLLMMIVAHARQTAHLVDDGGLCVLDLSTATRRQQQQQQHACECTEGLQRPMQYGMQSGKRNI
jgi:hypothetical protein